MRLKKGILLSFLNKIRLKNRYLIKKSHAAAISSYCYCCSLISVYLNGTAIQLGYGGSVSPQQKSPPFKDGLNVYFLRLVRTLIWCCTTRGLGMQSSDLGLSLSAGPSCAVLPSRAGFSILTIQVRCKARAPTMR